MYVRRLCGCGKPIEEHWCDASREFNAPPLLCTCGGQIVHATVSMTGSHSGQCPVGLALLREWQERQKERDGDA